MRFILIPSDKVVTIDGESYRDLNLEQVDPTIHAVQWYETWGEIEYIKDENEYKPENQKIYSLDSFQFAIDEWNKAKILANAPEEQTEEDLLRECKKMAQAYLMKTDWTQLPDVASNLSNKQEFDNFREIVRVYAVSPVTNPVWPELPTAQWL
jgi:hypothetical protein